LPRAPDRSARHGRPIRWHLRQSVLLHVIEQLATPARDPPAFVRAIWGKALVLDGGTLAAKPHLPFGPSAPEEATSTKSRLGPWPRSASNRSASGWKRANLRSLVDQLAVCPGSQTCRYWKPGNWNPRRVRQGEVRERKPMPILTSSHHPQSAVGPRRPSRTWSAIGLHPRSANRKLGRSFRSENTSEIGLSRWGSARSTSQAHHQPGGTLHIGHSLI